MAAETAAEAAALEVESLKTQLAAATAAPQLARVRELEAGAPTRPLLTTT
jgi:hypothetical protein